MKKEKKNKSWRGILLIVLLLAIGFAAVTTTLVINGTINFGANADNFKENLIFTDAKLEYSDTNKTAVTEGLIAADGKSIEFTTDTLTMIGETAKLTYEITNGSQYDADLKEIVCTVKNAADQDVTDAVVTNKTGDYIKLETSNVAGTVVARNGKKSGNTITVTMIKSYVGTPEQTAVESKTSYTVNCTIDAEGVSASATTTTTPSANEGA